MNKIVVILILAVAAIAGVAIAYVLKIPPAVQLVEAIQQKIGGITGDGGITAPELNISTIASGASLATAATTAIGWIKTNKEKALALKDTAKAELENSGLMQQIDELKGIKETALSEVESIKTDMESLKQEKDAAVESMSFLETENEKLRNTIDTLHETLRRNKLTDGESIVKTKVV